MKVRLKKIFIFLFFLSLLSVKVFSNSNFEIESFQYLNPSLEGVEGINELSKIQKVKVIGDSFNLKYPKKDLYIRIKVAKRAFDRVVSLKNNYFQNFKIYFKTTSNQREYWSSDKAKVLKLKNRYPSYKIPPHVNEFLIQAVGNSKFTEVNLSLPIEVLKLDSYYEKQFEEKTLYSFFYGIIILLIIYNTFNYFSSKYINYILFSLFGFVLSLTLMVFVSFLKGVWLSGQGLNGLIALSGTILLLFGKSYINLEKEDLVKVCNKLIKGGFILSLVCFILPFKVGSLFSYFYLFVNAFFAMWLSYVQLKKGSVTAKYFFISLFSFIFLAGVQFLFKFKVLIPYLLVEHSLLLGTSFKLIILSFGFAEYIKSQRDDISIRAEELNDANHKLKLLYRKIEKTNTGLENKVKARTNELFSSLNETKDILNNMRQAVFSVDESYKVIFPVSKYSKEIFGVDIVGRNVCAELFDQEFREKIAFVFSISINMDIFQFESMQDVIPKMTSLKMKEGAEKIVKIQLSPITNDQDIVQRIMFIVEDITEEEKLKEAVRVSQEKAEYRIQVLQEIVSNTRSEFRVFIKEVFETLEDWGDEEGAKRSLHTIKGTSRFFNLESLSHKVHRLETQYEKSGIESTKEQLVELLNFYKESAQEVFGEDFISSESDGSEEFIEVPKTKFEVALHSANQMTSAKAVLRIFSNLMMSELKGELEKLKPTVFREARKLEKNVTFKVNGVEALFERKNAKMIRESVIHLINNSIAHGIEKNGNIEVELIRKRPDIILTLKDNGRGINGEDVYNKAIEKGLIDPVKDFLSEKEKTELIFKPGFSTASNVTEISGRGVGIDVVLKNIESLGGRIEIETKVGEGTTFSLIIPSL